MIGPDDIHETPKPNYTPILVLGIAAVLLLIVGFISYRDYKNNEAEKQLAKTNQEIEKLRAQIAQMTPPVNNYQPAPGVAASPQPAPAVPDPELIELRRQLKAMQDKQAETAMKMEKVLERTAPPAPPEVEPIADPYSVPPVGSGTSNFAGIPNVTPGPLSGPPINDPREVPDYIKDSVSAPPGGQVSAAAQERMSALKRQIMNSPAIGKITGYDPDWGFVTIDAGTANGVRKGSRFSIRRGGDLLGDIRLEQVNADESIGVFATRGHEIEGALKPQVGDDIISSQSF